MGKRKRKQISRNDLESKFAEKMDPLDKLFTLFFLFSPVACGLAISLGIDQRLLWFNVMLFLVWTLYIYWYRGVYLLKEQIELSLIERIRGLAYFFSFVATFILNNFSVFYPSLTNSLIVIVLVGISLLAITLFTPKAFFSKQTALFKSEQKDLLVNVLSMTGSVSIYYSMSVAIFSSFLYQEIGIFFDLLVIVLLSFLVALVFQRERRSREFSRALAASLRDSHWIQRYLTQRKVESISKKRRTKT